MVSRFHLIPERYGQTDRQTDRFAISISRVSMLMRDKNRTIFAKVMLKWKGFSFFDSTVYNYSQTSTAINSMIVKIPSYKPHEQQSPWLSCKVYLLLSRSNIFSTLIKACFKSAWKCNYSRDVSMGTSHRHRSSAIIGDSRDSQFLSAKAWTWGKEARAPSNVTLPQNL